MQRHCECGIECFIFQCVGSRALLQRHTEARKPVMDQQTHHLGLFEQAFSDKGRCKSCNWLQALCMPNIKKTDKCKCPNPQPREQPLRWRYFIDRSTIQAGICWWQAGGCQKMILMCSDDIWCCGIHYLLGRSCDQEDPLKLLGSQCLLSLDPSCFFLLCPCWITPRIDM